jgi:fluoride exporter
MHGPARFRLPRTDILLAISAGAALGAPARYGLTQLIGSTASGFPLATVVINVSGSLLLGMFLILTIERFPPTRYVRPFFATGLLGSYTTFSTFAVETDLLLRDGHVATAVAYTAASLLLGLGAAWAGMAIGRTLPNRRTT